MKKFYYLLNSHRILVYLAISINKGCSLLVVEHMYICLESIDTKSTVCGTCQFLVYMIIGPRWKTDSVEAPLSTLS